MATMTTFPTERFNAPTPAEVELASRLISRRRLLPFVQRLNDRYLAGWVHKDICRRLEKFSDDVAKGLSPRLMLLMPPRSGKSELCSRAFPSWHLGRNPDHEIIACSYNVSLAMSFSKKVKEVLEDPTFHPVFDIRLNPNNQSAEEWSLDGKRGGYVAAGVGGGITGKGAHCLPAGTLVNTALGAVDIATLYLLKCTPKVYSFDQATKQVVLREIRAFSMRSSEDLFEITTTAGRILVLTGDHPVYLPDTDEFVRADRLEALYGTTKDDDRPNLRNVRGSVPARQVQPQQVTEVELPRLLLLEALQPTTPCLEEPQEVPALWTSSDCGGSQQRGKILQPGLLASGTSVARGYLSAMRGYLRPIKRQVHILLQGLRQRSPFGKDDRGGQFALQGRPKLRQVVPGDAPSSDGARPGLRGVPEDIDPAHPPCGPRPDKQHPRELSAALSNPPHNPPQIIYDTLALVRRVCSGPIAVYDLEVEGTHNFFANGICVHNCLIIDDPIKNAEEADSADTREKLWDWYGSTAYTRLAPGGGVLVVQTFWHDDDLAGRLQNAMRADPDADKFVVVKYPAIAEHNEWYDPVSDLIVEDEPGHPDQILYRRKGEALHPERYDIKKLEQIKLTISPRFWSALYQQNPVPDDGAYFLKEHFRRAPVPHVAKANVFIAWDFAISEKKQNDYTVGTVLLQDEDDTLHVVEQVRFKSADAFFIVEAILNLSKKWYTSGQRLGFEDGQIYRAIESLLKKRMRERREYPSIQVLKPITDKLARARPLQGRMQQGRVSFNASAEWYDVCRLEMLRFPAGAHDDCVDSLSWAVQMAIGAQPPRRAKTKELPSWRDRIGRQSGSHSHMGV